MREDGEVWKVIYREGGSKNSWEVVNAIKKHGKTRFFYLTTDKTCGANHRP